MLQRSFVLTTAILATNLATAYKIDASCATKGIETDVRNAMTNAFEMVDASLRHLNANPYDQHVTALVKRLFIAKDGQDPNDRNRMSKVKLILENINEFYRNEVTGDNVPDNDVTIYCDDSRFTQDGLTDEEKKKKLWRDSTNGEVLRYNDQMCKGSALDFVALAVTDNVEHEESFQNAVTGMTEYYYTDLPTQIQICPWLVDWVKDKEFKTGNDVMRSNIGRAVIKTVEKTNWGLRQIDAFALLDKVLLHEMTHGRAAWDVEVNTERYEGTTDVQTPRNFFLMPLLPVPAYGWKWARQLATLGEDVNGINNWKVKAADNNADSIALFGSAARLLDHEWSRLVEDDGKVVPNV